MQENHNEMQENLENHENSNDTIKNKQDASPIETLSVCENLIQVEIKESPKEEDIENKEIQIETEINVDVEEMNVKLNELNLLLNKYVEV